MEIKLNTVQVATLKDNFAFLEKITDFDYEYKFSLDVSKTAISSTNANKVVIRTYLSNPKNDVSTSIFNLSKNQSLSLLNLNSSQLVSNIKRRNYRVINEITNARQSYLTINDYNLNDLVNKFNNGVGYTLINPNKIKKSIRNLVFDSGISIKENFLREDRTIQQINLEMLYQHKIDPANFVKRIFTSNTAYETNNGSSTNFFPQNISNLESLALTNFLYKNSNVATQQAIIQTFNIKDREIISIDFNLTLPIAILGESSFFVMFSFYDIKNDLVQEFVKFIPHKNNLDFIRRPKLPPILNISKLSGGNLCVTLQQLDPNAVGVKFYKTVYNSTRNNDAITQDFVGSYNLSFGETRIINLQNDSIGLLLFRAVSFDALGNSSTDFSSATIEIFPNDVTRGEIQQNNFVVLKSEYTFNGLNILINDLPPNITYVNLYKSDITEDINEKESLLSTILVRGNGNLSTYGFLDTNLQEYRRYRYSCELIDNKGQVYNSSANIELYYRPVNQSYVTVTANSPIVTPIQYPDDSTQYFDVSFNISYAIERKLEDDVRDLLVSQGLIQYYGGDIDKNRLRELVTTKIELRDLNTNDVYFMGFFDSAFVQSTTKFGLLTKPSKYVYILTTYIRSPKTLLESFIQTSFSTPRINGSKVSPSYEYIPFNLNNPFGLLAGTNPKTNGNEFTTQYGIDQLAIASIGSILEIPLNLNPPTPGINNFTAILFNSRNVELVWSVNGNQSEIAFFIIRRQDIRTGHIDIIGKAHGLNSQNAYSFVDPIRYTETGIYRYIITMEYTDMSLSSDYYTNEVVI